MEMSCGEAFRNRVDSKEQVICGMSRGQMQKLERGIRVKRDTGHSLSGSRMLRADLTKFQFCMAVFETGIFYPTVKGSFMYLKLAMHAYLRHSNHNGSPKEKLQLTKGKHHA